MFIRINAVRLPVLKSTMHTTRRTKILYSRFPKRVLSTKVCTGQYHLPGWVVQIFVRMTCFTLHYYVHFTYIKVSNVGRLNDVYTM